MKTRHYTQNDSIDNDQTRIAQEPKKISDMDEHFNNYFKIESIIGEGGMGRVFLAYDEVIGRRVAIKELLDFEDNDTADGKINNQDLKNTFIHEAKLTGKLEHPGIIPIYELGFRKQNQPYYVMPYVRGKTLESLLKKCNQFPHEKQLGERLKLLDILIDCCETVAYAHSKGVIHRDLKPSNIIRGEFGETIVLDWGLAQVLDEDNSYFYREALKHQRNTLNDTMSSETTLGTPCYMAPEQFDGNTDKSSDVYTLGVILFRLLTGKLPYRGDFDTIQQKVNNQTLSSPSAKEIEKSAPPELVSICDKAMQKDPHMRFANAKEMAEQLKAFRDGRIVDIYAYSRKELLRRFWLRNKSITIMALALLVTIFISAGLSFHYAVKMHHAKTIAEKGLVTISTYSEIAQKQAKEIAKAIKEEIIRLSSDLNIAAKRLAKKNLSQNSQTSKILTELHNQYPKFQKFTIKPIQSIPSLSISDWSNPEQTVLIPNLEIRQQQLKLIFRQPIIQDQEIQYFIEAESRPEVILPDMFPITLESSEFHRDVWIMDQDGLVVYDKESDYLGTNLFLDPKNQNSPALLAFGRLSMTDNNGIGYYSFIENHQKIYKIAAWNNVDFSSSMKWSVIVDYPYMVNALASD